VRKLIAWGLVASAALCLSQLAWAGSPTSQGVKRAGDILEVRIVGSLAGSAVDSITIDLKGARWSTTTATEGLAVLVANVDSDIDSMTVEAEALAHTSVTTATGTLTAAQLDGTVQVASNATVFGRYWQIIMTNLSSDSTDTYDVRIQVPAR